MSIENLFIRKRKMILTEEQKKMFKTASEPLIEFLNNNCDPHMTVHVETSGAHLSEGVHNYNTEAFIKD